MSTAEFIIGAWLFVAALGVIGVIHADRRDARDRGGAAAPGGADLGTAAYSTAAVSAGPGFTLGADPKPREAPRARVVDEPLRGWKNAYLVLDRYGVVHFSATGVTATYGVDERARCVGGKNHRAPDPGCMCGFYALRDREHAAARGGLLLEVDLYGRIIVGEHGYRAEHQRVLSATIFGDPWMPCRGLEGAACGMAARWVLRDGTPLCAWHAIESGKHYAEVDIIERLREGLPTEWRVEAGEGAVPSIWRLAGS